MAKFEKIYSISLFPFIFYGKLPHNYHISAVLGSKIKRKNFRCFSTYTSKTSLLNKNFDSVIYKASLFYTSTRCQYNRYNTSQILVFKSIYIGFLIKQEEERLGLGLSIFWVSLSTGLKAAIGSNFSRSFLFEARRLYKIFNRFTKVINNDLSICDINIPSKLTKQHLLVIATYCSNQKEEDFFIKKVMKQSLTVHELKA